MNRLSFLLGVLLFLSCTREKHWVFEKKITLDDSIRPLGIAKVHKGLWISDPDNNSIFLIDLNGEIQNKFDSIDRPMQISAFGDNIYVPAFASDTVWIFKGNKITFLETNETFDAPAGISVLDEMVAIADFYNHRVLLIKNGETIQIGKEGRTNGLLYYPTDVELTNDKVVVADAYNNRVQVFDLNGNFLKVIGWQEDIKVATGVEIDNNKIFVTDYHGARVLIYNFEGTLLEIFEGHFNKPSDILIDSNKFFVTNYGENSITVYSLE
jgi:DNA-binding beta-propeller fold protein YncE